MRAAEGHDILIYLLHSMEVTHRVMNENKRFTMIHFTNV